MCARSLSFSLSLFISISFSPVCVRDIKSERERMRKRGERVYVGKMGAGGSNLLQGGFVSD